MLSPLATRQHPATANARPSDAILARLRQLHPKLIDLSLDRMERLLARLGHPERALRAFSQWRSSWLSREGVCAVVTLVLLGCYTLIWMITDVRIVWLGWLITIGAVAKELHTADFLVGAIQGGIPALALPAALMLLSMAIAFATGTSWGTYAVVFPIAMPLAWAFHPDARFVEICFGAVLGGSVFGDQCSPISDTTILSSMFTGCDLMDHVKTQLPLALSAAGLAALCSTLLVVVGR